MVEFKDITGLIAWLDNKPWEFAAVIALRSSMRALPGLDWQHSAGLVLPVFRAISVMQATAVYLGMKVGKHAHFAATGLEFAAEKVSSSENRSSGLIALSLRMAFTKKIRMKELAER